MSFVLVPSFYSYMSRTCALSQVFVVDRRTSSPSTTNRFSLALPVQKYLLTGTKAQILTPEDLTTFNLGDDRKSSILKETNLIPIGQTPMIGTRVGWREWNEKKSRCVSGTKAQKLTQKMCPGVSDS
jgi:hypothetical protein